MEAGLCDHVWTVEEICGLLPEKKAVSSVKATEKAMLLKALTQTVKHSVLFHFKIVKLYFIIGG